MNAGVITPVTCVSSTDLSGVDMLLKRDRPAAASSSSEKDAMVGENADGDALEVECRESDPLAAFVFRPLPIRCWQDVFHQGVRRYTQTQYGGR
ncbi:hypothetical protein [Ruminococcus albus]|uniref:hypothetical protein n=1 Tax=Ruminococcus albus TaxID=1264 RepID=UPI001D14C973|nr:hypothetical protein [Ruminococcus albus]MCC3351687.1 hypothetical protein [Ruminococcus albus 8]